MFVQKIFQPYCREESPSFVDLVLLPLACTKSKRGGFINCIIPEFLLSKQNFHDNATEIED